MKTVRVVVELINQYYNYHPVWQSDWFDINDEGFEESKEKVKLKLLTNCYNLWNKQQY